jgi:hypothetical protein
MCHSSGSSSWWAEFDAGSNQCIDTIRIKNREACCRDRIVGTQVSVRSTRDGEKLWTNMITGALPVYNLYQAPTPAPPAPTESPTPANVPTESPRPGASDLPNLLPNPEFACEPTVGETKDSECHGRGYLISAAADLGVTLGIVGQNGCLMEKSGYEDHAVELPDSVMPRMAYALTQDASKCQHFRVSDTTAGCGDTPTENCRGWLGSYPGCVYPPAASCPYRAWFETHCGETFGYCVPGRYQFEGIDALGRKPNQGGIGLLGAQDNNLEDTNVIRPSADNRTLFTLSDNVFSHSSGLQLRVVNNRTNSNVSFCTICDFPYHGRYCDNPVSNPTEQIDVLIVVFLTDWKFLAVEKQIDQYQQDLLKFEKKTSDVLRWDVPQTSQLRPHRELRHVLRTEYAMRSIEAAFFIGEFPAAWVSHRNFYPAYDSTPRSTDPTMLYYGALNATFTDDDCDGVLDLPGGRLKGTKMDISVGILNQAEPGDIALYFDRLHAHREAGGHPVQKQWSFNEGDWNCDAPTPLYESSDFSDGHFCYEGKPYNATVDRETYEAMANNDTVSFEYYNAHSHAWHGGFGFGSSVDGLWGKPYSGISFFTLFHCSSARMTEKNLAAMMAIGSVHGLAATGCTHTGAMLCNHVFESRLAAGDSWGEAFKYWFEHCGQHYESWHTGQLIYGDPMVRLRGGRIRANSLLQLVEDQGAMNEPINKTRIDEEKKFFEQFLMQDIELEKEHAAEDQSVQEYNEARSHLLFVR